MYPATLRLGMDLSKKERIARHKRFLAANWQLLAAFAWEHYQSDGRGAVVVDERDFVRAATPQYTAIRLRYVADHSPLLKDIGGWPGDKERDWVRSYDPDVRVVVMVIREGGGTSGYLIGAAARCRTSVRNCWMRPSSGSPPTT